MAFADFRSFLDHLEARGDLVRVRAEVDPEYEIAEIAQRGVREGMPALRFERVRGSRYPVVMNALASFARIEAALGAHPQAIGERLVRFAQDVLPPTPGALWRHRADLARALAMRPRRVRRAPCQAVVERDVDLSALPVLRCWPLDGGRFITLPLVFTRDPATGRRNTAIYRMQVYDRETTGMHWQLHKGGGFHFRVAESRGEALPVAVALGADPVLMLVAMFPLPESLEEVALAGLLRGAPTRLVRARTVDALVPAGAEIVLEGEVPPFERRAEGPFGDHFGHYCEVAEFPVFRVRAITRRPDAVYPAAVVGRPPQEDRYMGDAAQMILGPLIRLMRPEVRDVWAYYEAGFHNLLVVSMASRYARESVRTALGLLGEGQLGLSKVVVLVDEDVDARDFGAVLRAIRRHFDPVTRFHLIANAPLDTLDFTSFTMHLGSRMILDATGEREPYPAPPSTAPSAPRPREPRVDDALHQGRVHGVVRTRLWNDALLLVQVSGRGEGIGARVVETMRAGAMVEHVPLVAVVSDDVNLDDDVDAIWGVFTRFDPARDVRFASHTPVGPCVVCRGPMFIDATWKPGYPEPVRMPDEIVRRVDARWRDCFPRS